MSEVERPEPKQEQEQEQEEFDFPLPPASFDFLVMSLRAQAEVQLGLMHFGQKEKPKPQLNMARHTIDLMGILLEKTKGNLNLEEQRVLENSLTELRFRYVQVAEEAAGSQGQTAAQNS
jgi:hypothetical protein